MTAHPPSYDYSLKNRNKSINLNMLKKIVTSFILVGLVSLEAHAEPLQVHEAPPVRYLRRTGRKRNKEKRNHGSRHYGTYDSVSRKAKKSPKKHCNSKYMYGCNPRPRPRPCNSKYMYGCSPRPRFGSRGQRRDYLDWWTIFQNLHSIVMWFLQCMIFCTLRLPEISNGTTELFV